MRRSFPTDSAPEVGDFMTGGGSRGPGRAVVLTGGFATSTDLTGGPQGLTVLTDLTGVLGASQF